MRPRPADRHRGPQGGPAHPLTQGRVGVGIHYCTGDPIAKRRAVWRAVDEAGFDRLWNSDHLYPTWSDRRDPIFDAWTELAGMAALTRRVRIGVLVTGNLYRHPALLAKQAATVDHLSGGRLDVGIGAAWSEPEFVMAGMPFGPAAERARRLEEACVVLKALWTGEPASFAGRYYRLDEALLRPAAFQRPHPPLLVGGRGPVVTLRAAARHADAWDTGGAKPFEVNAEAARLLDEHCARIGRDPRTLRRQVDLKWTDAGASLDLARRYVEIGFTDFVIDVGRGSDPERDVERLAGSALAPLRSIPLRARSPTTAPSQGARRGV